MKPNKPNSSRGFTLVELAISLTMISIMLGGLMLVSKSISTSVRAGTASAALEAEGEAAVRRIADMLREAADDTVTPRPAAPISTFQVDYQRADAWTVKGLQWQPLERILLELRPGELDNGIDDNSNGVVDERRVTWITDPGAPQQRVQPICHWVREMLEGELPNGVDDNGNGLIDEAGLCIVFEGSGAIVRLTLERPDPDGRLMLRTFQSRIELRN